MERELLKLASTQHWVLTRTQLVEAVGEYRLKKLVRNGDVVRVHHGVYRVDVCEPTRAQQIHAAVLACGVGAIVSHATAAELHGLKLKSNGRIEISVPVNRRVSRPRIKVHRCEKVDEVVVIDGIPVTSLAQTFVDLAAELKPRPYLQGILWAFRQASKENQQLAWQVAVLLRESDRQGHAGRTTLLRMASGELARLRRRLGAHVVPLSDYGLRA